MKWPIGTLISLTRNRQPPKLVAAAVDLLEVDGPALGRPLVDSIEGSTVRNLKELRPGSQGRSEIRILFAFDPERQAVLLLAGDKAGNWTRWYADNIPLAERRFSFKAWLSGDYSEERGV
jgi:hypothetical protein